MKAAAAATAIDPIDLCLNKRLREGQHGLSPAIGRSAVHTKRCALKRLPRHVARDHTGNGARVGLCPL